MALPRKANPPINIAQLVPTLLENIGYCDASCKHIAGGGWILPQHDGTNRHVFWSTNQKLCSSSKTVNCQLTILKWQGFCSSDWYSSIYCHPYHLHNQDCTAIIALPPTGPKSSRPNHSSQATSKRALALCQQICKASALLDIAIPGIQNMMADIASRFSTDSKLRKNSPSLLHYFNTHFPQTHSWEGQN